MRNQFGNQLNDSGFDIWSAAPELSASQTDLESLLPRLHALSLRTHQWVTVIGARREVIEQLVAAGISRTRIRWVHGRNQDEREWATEQALLAGTSSLVLSWLGDLSPRMQQRLKMASKVSHTHSFVFNDLPSLPPLH
ncbi:SOS-response cell division inhibitor [Pseudidiomarina andamanensis]|uniref:SOS-response cell division inhibitor n=1 Tax=Pseudidiomarina andamanensis TaxID=1940690 RepID=A0AA92ETK5_9GAMM|nr:SOS-response cell division inhibitor [Pseudidiomarina andamanensis]MDS0219116.1 SOS-response cell division inhibitor [Pseudidiomarina andamanensis]QGT96462.1 SOS-response cell division inhibitor [Pseudidiomarina andamanensis]